MCPAARTHSTPGSFAFPPSIEGAARSSLDLRFGKGYPGARRPQRTTPIARCGLVSPMRSSPRRSFFSGVYKVGREASADLFAFLLLSRLRPSTSSSMRRLLCGMSWRLTASPSAVEPAPKLSLGPGRDGGARRSRAGA